MVLEELATIVTVGFEQQVCMWGDDSALKTRVITNPEAIVTQDDA